MERRSLELMIQIRQQQVVGNGMFLPSPEFKAWACKTYNISEQRLTELQKETLRTS